MANIIESNKGMTIEQIMKNLFAANKKKLYVGIPMAKTEREENASITNAELLFIHTNGSPVNNIPARPVIEPALKAVESELSMLIAKEIKNVIDGKSFNHDKIGLFVQNACRSWFTDSRNNWAPNSPATIAGKKSDRPLIDTGELRKSITYIIRG